MMSNSSGPVREPVIVGLGTHGSGFYMQAGRIGGYTNEKEALEASEKFVKNHPELGPWDHPTKCAPLKVSRGDTELYVPRVKMEGQVGYLSYRSPNEHFLSDFLTSVQWEKDVTITNES